jgi:hypothetical protein
MAGEDDWSGFTLKAYVDALFTEKQRQVDHALTSMDRRLDQMNEFRGQLADQAKNFMPRDEYVARHEDLTARYESLRASQQAMREEQATEIGAALSRQRLTSVAIAFVTIIVSVGTVVAIIVTH